MSVAAEESREGSPSVFSLAYRPRDQLAAVIDEPLQESNLKRILDRRRRCGRRWEDRGRR